MTDKLEVYQAVHQCCGEKYIGYSEEEVDIIHKEHLKTCPTYKAIQEIQKLIKGTPLEKMPIKKVISILGLDKPQEAQE